MKSKIKNLIKKCVPMSVWQWLARTWGAWRSRQMFAYDKEQFLKHSTNSVERSREGLQAMIIMKYHVVEKGLTMPGMRLGFGRENLMSLIELCQKFIDKFGENDPQVRAAIAVIAEYKKVHDDAHFALDDEHSRAIDALLKRVPIEPSQQIEMTRERYFADINAPFEQFSCSRHSVRNFAGTVSVEQIRAAVALANNAPSACNRQYMRVHCVSDHAKIQELLALQNGNRGFGHLADKLLVLTADLRCAWGFERRDIFVNAGIYLMNLCYALHKNKVAHCMLNFSTPPPN